MKKSVLVPFLILAATPVFSQEVRVISDTVVYFEYDAQMDSVRTMKDVSGYSSGGSLTSFANYSWDTDQQAWTGTIKLEYDNNLEGNYIRRTKYRWEPESGDWEPDEQVARAYNDAGSITMQVYYSWDTATSDWIGYMIEEITYNSGNKPTLSLIYGRDPLSGEWDFSQKVERTYDANGHEVLLLSSLYDPESGSWNNFQKIETGYNADTTLVTKTYYSWDNDLKDWHPGNRTEYSFDGSGYMTGTLTMRWDDGSGDWVNSSKSEYTNNAEGRTVLSVSYRWDPAEERWIESSKGETVYDEQGRWSYGISYSWDPGTEDWVRSYRSDIYYSEETSYMQDEAFTWNADQETWQTLSRSYISKLMGTLHADSAEICLGDSIPWQGMYLSMEGLYDTVHASGPEMPDIYSMKLVVHPTPGPFTITGDTLPVPNEILTYTVPEDTSLAYSWYAGNAEILSYPDERSAELQWGEAGAGWVGSVAENRYGCLSDTSFLEVAITPTTVLEELPAGIWLYPNPAGDHVFIRVDEGSLAEGCRLQVTALTGQIITETPVESTVQKVMLPGDTRAQPCLARLIGRDGRLIATWKIVIHQ